MATSPTPPTPSPLPPLHTHADRVHLPPGAADADTANPVGNAGRGAAPPSKLQTLWVATKQFTAGAIAGSCAKTFIAPLDRTKILFQVSQQPFSLRAAFNLAKSVVQEEGWRALYKGNFATVARVVPYSGIQLMAFDQYRAAFRRRLGLEVGARLPPMENFLAGAAAGATSVALTYPLDLMRARLAVQRTFHRYTGLGHAFRTALSDEQGIRALYRGVWPTLLGILPYAGLSFWTFESSKNKIHDWTGQPITTMQRLACGGLAGLVGQSATYPLDIVRRRLQTESFILEHLTAKGWSTQKHSIDRAEARVPASVHPSQASVVISGHDIRSVWATVIHREGLKGLWKGLAMNWIKGPIAVGVSFTVFDFLKRRFGIHDGGPTT